jgi:hypothetical protein
MRTMYGAALIGLAVAGGSVIAGSAQAQPYGYDYPPPSGYYDDYGYYHPAPTYSAPSYDSGSDAAGLAGAVIGSVLGESYYGSAVPVDQYGPDPNGRIAPDGHRIKCKLRTTYDGYSGRYLTRRECY